MLFKLPPRSPFERVRISSQEKNRLAGVAVISILWVSIGLLFIMLTLPTRPTKSMTDCGHGIVISYGGCLCDEFYSLDESGKCMVERKSLLTAVLTQLFFGFLGSGFHYIELSLLGWLQLACTLVVFLVYFFRLVKRIRTILVLGNLLAWFGTTLLMASGYFQDGHGYELI